MFIDFSQLSTMTFPIETVVQFVFYFVLAAYAIFTAIFYYHWQTYATDVKVTSYTLITYFAVTTPLIIVMAILAFVL